MADKKYNEFDDAEPTTARLILHADPTTGSLRKSTISELYLPQSQITELVNDLSIIGTEALKTRNISTSIYAALGGSIVAEPMYNISELNPAITLSNQKFVFIAVWLSEPRLIAGAMYYSQVAGNYTASNNNRIGMYSYSAGLCTLVASSANNGDLWKGTANTWQTAPFTTPYDATPGLYFIGYCYCRSAETTAPQIAGSRNTSSGNMGIGMFSNSAQIRGDISSQTDLPASFLMSTTSTINTNPYLALSI